mmetsp:Transcript_13037/g.24273  ORF Transcript_13037/g.24273 Transcript_13037/m.24273 type:complete len:170 (+) Transcript_13037:192-701(+)
MLFGKVAKVDGVLKSSTNRYIMKIDNIEELSSQLSTSPTVENEQAPPQPVLPAPAVLPKFNYKREANTRRTPPPRRPKTIDIPRASSTPKFEKQEEDIDKETDPQLVRTRIQQQMHINMLAKPRKLTPIRQLSKKKQANRATSLNLLRKGSWNRQRLRQLRAVYETIVN